MAIAVVGVGALSAATSGNITAAFPAAYSPTAGHLSVVVMVGKAATLSVDNSPASNTLATYTKRAAAFRTGGNGLQIAIYYKVFAGGEAAPIFTIPTDWAGASQGASVTQIVFSGVRTSHPFDTTETTVEQAANPFTPASITTVTANAMVVSVALTNDDNSLAFSTANSFTANASGASYQTTTGGDHSIGIGTLIKATAGAVTMCVWNQTVNGTDGSLCMTLALQDSASGTTYSQTVSGGITPTGALVNKTTKVLAGAITPAGALVKTATKALTGSITPSGALATTKLVLKSLTGSITPTGALVKQATKILVGGITPSGALVKQASKVFAGSLTPAGALVKQAGKVLTGAITPTGALVKRTTKVLAGGITPSGALAAARTFLKTLTGSITPGAGALVTTFISGTPAGPSGKVTVNDEPTEVTKLV